MVKEFGSIEVKDGDYQITSQDGVVARTEKENHRLGFSVIVSLPDQRIVKRCFSGNPNIADISRTIKEMNTHQ